uniref:Uncharacterized protein n=1 Tax=Parascaris equorum TaxID=6256 RepID=A0A914RTR7_PAREQ
MKSQAAESDAELKSLKGELTQAYQQIEKEYSLAREKDEHLLALRIEAHDLKAMIESVKAEKEAAEHRMEQVTVELTKMVEAQKAQEKRVKCFLDKRCGESRVLLKYFVLSTWKSRRKIKSADAANDLIDYLKDQW